MRGFGDVRTPDGGVDEEIYFYEPAMSDEAINKFDEVSGTLAVVLKVRSRWETDRDSFFKRFEKRAGADHDRWEDFLSADGVKRMWKRDPTGEPITGEKRKRSD